MGISNLIDRLNPSEMSDIEDDTPEDYADQVPDDASALDDALPPDPKPGQRGRTKARRAAPVAAKVTAAQKRTVEDSIYLLMMIPGGALSLRDPHCGGAVTGNAREVARACVPIVARNPSILAWFTATGAPVMDWLALLAALSPIASAFWSHHVTKSVGQDEEDEGANADYSQFTAPVFG